MQQSIVKPITAEESIDGARQWEYIISRMIGKAYTATLVRVTGIHGGAVAPVGFVDAIDLLQQVDGSGNGIPNVPMKNLPYFRLQGGGNAVIIDPKVGDIGIAVFAYRDISNAKKTKAEGVPASARTHDVSDGLYIGGLLNGTPSQYIHFLDSGINVKATGDIEFTTPANYVFNGANMTMNLSANATINAAAATVNAPLLATNTITAGGNIIDPTGSMQEMRNIFNDHDHNITGGSSAPGPTAPPNEKME